jgi:hypothetical protein
MRPIPRKAVFTLAEAMAAPSDPDRVPPKPDESVKAKRLVPLVR